LIALLSVTGLRVSEALKLTVADVTRDGLLIRETKFRKTRLVPLHDTAVAGGTNSFVASIAPVLIMTAVDCRYHPMHPHPGRGAVAENECDRIRYVKRNLASQGIFGGGKRPFGYNVVENKKPNGEVEKQLVPNATEQAALARVKQLRSRKMSLQDCQDGG
jgi:hypothetical protein